MNHSDENTHHRTGIALTTGVSWSLIDEPKVRLSNVFDHQARAPLRRSPAPAARWAVILLRDAHLAQKQLGLATGTRSVMVAEIDMTSARVAKPRSGDRLVVETMLCAKAQDLLRGGEQLVGRPAAHSRWPRIRSHGRHEEQQGVTASGTAPQLLDKLDAEVSLKGIDLAQLLLRATGH